jgi:hypothetical protein
VSSKLFAISVLVIAFVSFPLNKTVDVEINISKHKPKIVQTQATMKEKRANKKMALEFAKVGFGWTPYQQKCMVRLFTAESRFDHLADNPKSTAFGIGQVLSEKSKDPAIQILRAYRYIEHRYTEPCRALNHHLRKNWY